MGVLNFIITAALIGNLMNPLNRGWLFIKNVFFHLTPLAAYISMPDAKVPPRHLQISPQYGVYSTALTARSKKINDLMRLADETEVNSIVIDVKEDGDYLDDNIKNLVGELHNKNIYIVARIVLFKDNSQTKIHPDWYFKKSDGSFWADNRGWRWLDPANKETWDYNIGLAKKAIDYGFDELNFDYIRFPAFKKDDDVNLPPDFASAKIKTIDEFARHLTSELKKYDPEIALSVDLFAYSMLRRDDLGVGQVFADLYDRFDYVSPMIYPSHYLPGNFGFDNPAEHPYEVILSTIESGKDQLRQQISIIVGTTTPSVVEPALGDKLKKLRPWLQDFNIGAEYNAEMIRQEKKAVYDAGLTSGWLLWNPNNVYTEGALDEISN